MRKGFWAKHCFQYISIKESYSVISSKVLISYMAKAINMKMLYLKYKLLTSIYVAEAMD